MYKFALFLFLLCFIHVLGTRIDRKDRDSTLDSHLRSEYDRKFKGNFRPVDIRESIQYERKNNYELYRDVNKKLQQHKVSVTEPRQILKKNVADFRYLVNDAEVIFNVYPFEPRYEKKILRETLKPASVCFIIAGLLLNKLDDIHVNNSPLYGFVVRGHRSSNDSNSVSNELSISAVLSNVEYPLGVFEFPVTDELHYQLPFLVGYYENLSGYNKKNFSYICNLPKFLIDVFYTTPDGLKFNFNGKALPAVELFPITITYFNANSSSVPVQKLQAERDEVNKAHKLIQQVGDDVKIRNVTASGAVGIGLSHPLERANANASFIKFKESVRSFLSNPKGNDLAQEHVAPYFLILASNLFSAENVKDKGFISSVEVSKVKTNNLGYLNSFTLKVTLDNGNTIEVEGNTDKSSKIPVPGNAIRGTEISATISPGYGFKVTSQGLKHVFCESTDDFSKLLDYRFNKLANQVF